MLFICCKKNFNLVVHRPPFISVLLRPPFISILLRPPFISVVLWLPFFSVICYCPGYYMVSLVAIEQIYCATGEVGKMDVKIRWRKVATSYLASDLGKVKDRVLDVSFLY